MKFKRFMREVHLWLSVPFGLVFFMMCITGSILVFENEITNAFYGDVRDIADPQGAPLPEAELKAKVIENLGEGTELKRIEKSGSADKAYKAVFAKPRGKAVYVNQYTGAVLGDASQLTFFARTQELHRWLLDPPKDGKSVGRQIVGWSVVASLVIILTGFVLWLSFTSQGLGKALKISAKSTPLLWFTYHRTMGACIFIIVLIIILTGLTWAFPAYKEVVVSLFGNMQFKAVHTGAWLGIVSKIIWFIAALIGASLPITGYYMWIRTLRKH